MFIGKFAAHDRDRDRAATLSNDAEQIIQALRAAH